MIVVKGQRDMLSYRAHCCNPLPGDQIVGYVTRGRGVAVHAAHCPNVRKLLFTPEREVEVEWAAQAGVYAVPVHVGFEDRPGMLAAISQGAAGEDVNIRSCHLSTNDDGLGMADLVLDVRGRDHLEKVIGALRRVSGVMTVETEGSLQGRRLRAL